MSATEWIGLAAQASIMLTVFGLGLTAAWGDALYLFRRPAQLAKALVSMNVVMPIVASAFATMVAHREEVKIALVALAVSPVPPILQKKQLKAGGSEGYVVGLLVAMSLLAIIIVPLTVVIFDQVFHRSASVSPAAIAKVVGTAVLVPLAVGLMVRRFVSAAEKAAGPVIAIAGILLVIAAAFMLYGLWPVTRSFIGNGLAVMLAIIAMIGLFVGHALGGPDPGDRTALAMATASRHPAIAMAVATSGANPERREELAIIVLYLIVATIVSIPYQRWRARRGH